VKLGSIPSVFSEDYDSKCRNPCFASNIHVSFLPTMKSLDNVIAGDRSAPQNEELNYDFERNNHFA
jgi:hypothetical protein